MQAAIKAFYFPFLILFFFKGEISDHLTAKEQPVLEFSATTISFDTIAAGQEVAGVFDFKNTGNEALVITRVQASDGGTIADWPHEPIMPGKEGIIKVRLGFTASRAGTYQDKLFVVISNAGNGSVQLHLKGYVKNKFQD